MILYHSRLSTPVGELLIAVTGQGLRRIYLPVENKAPSLSLLKKDETGASLIESIDKCQPVLTQLLHYFQGEKNPFSLELDFPGTAFQWRVMQEVAQIPYGQTATYGEVARRLGSPKASRAIGHANARNPIPIVLPCHRVIGTGGKLTGYGGGLAMKRWLLTLEKGDTTIFIPQ